MRSREKNITATFVGLDGSCGFRHGKEYTLSLRKISLQNFFIKDLDGKSCVYASTIAFLENWDNVKSIKTK